MKNQYEIIFEDSLENKLVKEKTYEVKNISKGKT